MTITMKIQYNHYEYHQYSSMKNGKNHPTHFCFAQATPVINATRPVRSCRWEKCVQSALAQKKGDGVEMM